MTKGFTKPFVHAILVLHNTAPKVPVAKNNSRQSDRLQTLADLEKVKSRLGHLASEGTHIASAAVNHAKESTATLYLHSQRIRRKFFRVPPS
jgi:hypothetical protein